MRISSWKLDPAAMNSLGLIRFFRGTVAAGLAIDSQQDKLIPGPDSALLTVPAGYSPATPMLTGFTNAASFAMDTGAYPGALVTLVGVGFHGAPETVMIAGVAAPVLYAGPNQINVQIPFEAIAGHRESVISVGRHNHSTAHHGDHWGFLRRDGTHAAAVNQDGTVNSAANPAAMGSVVTLYGTGAVWPYGMADGGVPPPPLPGSIRSRTDFRCSISLPGYRRKSCMPEPRREIIDGVFQMN